MISNTFRITPFKLTLLLALQLGLFAVMFNPGPMSACPFCSAINLTFAEQMAANDIVVVAKLLEAPPVIDDPEADLPKAKFSITKVLKGDVVKEGMEFRTILVGREKIGTEFLIMGVDPPRVAWSTPMKAGKRVVEYISKLDTLPGAGPGRLEFFQKYFEDEDSLLAFDAYDEFAKAPYKDMIALKPKMDREQLVEWIKSPETSINRRRLYFVMLGICGVDEDVKMLEGFIKSGDRKLQRGLDSLIACYLNLKGADGIGLIEKEFLVNRKVEYVDTLAAVSALRFHGTEMDIVPRKRIVSAIRLLLDRPRMADMIIPDLARWEDWSVMEKLVTLFKEADEDTNWIRVPIITYLRACPKPEAKTYISELAKIDPNAVRRADYFLDFEVEDDMDDDDSEVKESEEKDSEESVSDSGNDKSDDQAKLDAGESGRPLESETRVVVKKTPMEMEGAVSESAASETTVNSLESIKTGVELNQDSPEPNLGEVSTVYDGTVPSMADTPADFDEEVAQVGQPLPPTPVAVTTTPNASITSVLVVPMVASMAIFLLLWSVISGWFERLIF